MELEVENFKGGIIARRCKPPILPHQDQVEDKSHDEEILQDEHVKDSRTIICTITCSKTPLHFSSSPLFWTVPKLIGHQNASYSILDKALFLTMNSQHFCKILLLDPIKLHKAFFRKVWDPGGLTNATNKLQKSADSEPIVSQEPTLHFWHSTHLLFSSSFSQTPRLRFTGL